MFFFFLKKNKKKLRKLPFDPKKCIVLPLKESDHGSCPFQQTPAEENLSFQKGWP